MIGAAIDIAGAVDRLERGFDLLADAVDRVQIGAEDLDADIGAHAGREHFDAVDDRLREDVAPAGHLQHAAHFVIDQIALGARLSRPEEDAVAETAFPAPREVEQTAQMRRRSNVVAELRFERLAAANVLGFVAVRAHLSTDRSLLARFGQLLPARTR